MVKVNRSYLKPFLLSSNNYDKVSVSISVGQVISVEYLDITGDEVSYIKFTGVCLKKKKIRGLLFITLRGAFKWETIDLSFNVASPLIKNLKVLYFYKKKPQFYNITYLNIKNKILA